jgi:surface polysaccharide O-acyltransferase-like enzyme
LNTGVRVDGPPLPRGVAGPSPLETTLGYLSRRAVRLYIPFLVWTIIYAGLGNLGVALATTVEPTLAVEAPHLSWANLIMPVVPHLWFLPYILVISILVAPLVAWAAMHRVRETWLAGTLGALGLALAMSHQSNMFSLEGDWGWLAETAWTRTPCFLWGAAVALLWKGGMPRLTGSLAWSGVAAIGCIELAAASYVTGLMTMMVSMLAMAAFLLAMSPLWSGEWARKLRGVGKLCFGVYLSHMLFVSVCVTLLGFVGIDHTWWSDLGTVAFAICGGLLLTAILHRSTATRWLVS